MENKNYSDVIGQSDQPYTNSLASRYGLATKSYGVGHPSLPNYLPIISGSNQGVTVDEPPSSSGIFNQPTIASQLATAGYTAKAYAENLPANPANDSGEYAVRHFPWEYFAGKPSIADASRLTTDLSSASAPDFVWYTPNLINDEHDGSVQQGDAFLSSFIPGVQATTWYKSGGQIIITWDESNNDNSGINGGYGGKVPTIVVSASNNGRSLKDATPVDTAGILRSIEDRYGLPYLANAANSANGTIDSLLGTAPSPTRSITNAARTSAVAGQTFWFNVTTTGTPTPRLKKKGRLPKGVHFLNYHNGSGMIWGTPNPRRAVGTHQVTIVATYGTGKTKQVVTQVFTLTVAA